MDVRKTRERTGTDARKAIQMARYWADKGDAQKATQWAHRAVIEVDAFRRAINAKGGRET